MLILLDREAFKSPLPDMATASIVPMISSDMGGQPPLHERTERIGGQWLQHEVEMIRHEAKSKDFHWIFRFSNSH